MIAQRFLRSVSRWLTRHRRAGSCRKRAEAGMNQGGSFDRFTERARHAMRLAQEEAQRLQHNYIGTEHLLLGVLPSNYRLTSSVRLRNARHAPE